MKKYILFSLLAGVICFTSSNLFAFATLTAPQGGDRIVFDTNVNNVRVYLNGVKVGVKRANSFVIKVRRSAQDQVFTFKKAGYKEERVVLTKSLTPMFWGNFLIGGSLGSSTDSLFTKNSMEYSPNQYFITLTKI